jgi:FtsH-binding integral membrane protein
LTLRALRIRHGLVEEGTAMRWAALTVWIVVALFVGLGLQTLAVSPRTPTVQVWTSPVLALIGGTIYTVGTAALAVAGRRLWIGTNRPVRAFFGTALLVGGALCGLLMVEGSRVGFPDVQAELSADT